MKKINFWFLNLNFKKIFFYFFIFLFFITLIFYSFFNIFISKDFIKSFGYDSSFSATGKRVDNWMNIEKTYNNGNQLSYEPSLMKNKNYNSIKKDSDVVEGVYYNNGIGYQSENILLSQKNFNNKYRELELFDDGKYKNPKDKDYPLKDSLDVVFRVPGCVSDLFKFNLLNYEYEGEIKNGLIWTDDFNFSYDYLNKEQKNYFNFLKKENLLWELFFNYFIFNYFLFSNEIKNYIENNEFYHFEFYTPSKLLINDEEFDFYLKNYEKNLKIFFGIEIFGNRIYELKFEGTETLRIIISIAFEKLNIFLQEKKYLNKNEKITFLINNLYGSSQAWNTPNEFNGESWVVENSINFGDRNPSISSFIGFQSRRFDSKEIEFWKYKINSEENNNIDEPYETWKIKHSIGEFDDQNYFNEPLCMTIGLENTVFITSNSKKSSFEINGEIYYLSGLKPKAANLIFTKNYSIKELYKKIKIEEDLVEFKKYE